ncbi:GM16112 [Drosophila sechellia]|uniref:GM16112 n=1 Tax=Drosophila sechellia TaxID=7238 RepID=B4IIJ8_DROSE|nr:GM16112 [Drosophila sechellia]
MKDMRSLPTSRGAWRKMNARQVPRSGSSRPNKHKRRQVERTTHFSSQHKQQGKSGQRNAIVTTLVTNLILFVYLSLASALITDYSRAKYIPIVDGQILV